MADHDYLNPLSTKLDAAQVVRRSYDEDSNRIRVDAEVTATIGTVDVVIDAAGGDNIAIADETGTNFLDINPDGSISVVVQESSLTNKNTFNEITGLVSGVTSTIVNYTALIDTQFLSVDFSGTNIAEYSLYVNGILSAKKYTYWCDFGGRFDFGQGLELTSGDTVELEVVHMRPDPGNFNGNIVVRN